MVCGSSLKGQRVVQGLGCSECGCLGYDYSMDESKRGLRVLSREKRVLTPFHGAQRLLRRFYLIVLEVARVAPIFVSHSL